MPQIVDAGVRLLISLVSNIDTIVTTVVKAIPQIIKGIVSALAQGVPQMVSAGGQLMRGLAQGLSGLSDWVWNKVKSILRGLTNRIKSFFGIHSPSTLFRDEIGENLALGLGEGFVDEMGSVTREMQDAIPTSFDVNSSLTGIEATNDYANMVNAFKEALYQVKIELDDEVAGAFVDRTVSKLIYT
jgi:phage-related protein